MVYEKLPCRFSPFFAAAEEKEVEIIRRRVEDAAVEHGIDIVGPGFKGRQGQAPFF